MSPVARALDAAVAAYQRVSRERPSPCRYQPTCSNYARDALALHGALRGAGMAVRRIARCHPWSAEGWDPVPGRARRGPEVETGV